MSRVCVGAVKCGLVGFELSRMTIAMRSVVLLIMKKTSI